MNHEKTAAIENGSLWFGKPVKLLVPLQPERAGAELQELAERAEEQGLERLSRLLAGNGALKAFLGAVFDLSSYMRDNALWLPQSLEALFDEPVATRLASLNAQIKQAAQRQLNTAEQQTTRQLSQIQSQTIGQLTALRKDSDYAWRSIQQSAHRQVKQAARLNNELRTQIQASAYQQLTVAASTSQNHKKTIMHSAQQQLIQGQRNSEYLRDIVLLHRPSRVLKQGYTMLTDEKDKQVLTSGTQLHPEQTVHILLKDGKAKAQIIDIKMNN